MSHRNRNSKWMKGRSESIGASKRNTPSGIYITTSYVIDKKTRCNYRISLSYLYTDHRTNHEPLPYPPTMDFILTDSLSVATSSWARLRSPFLAALWSGVFEFMFDAAVFKQWRLYSLSVYRYTKRQRKKRDNWREISERQLNNEEKNNWKK